MNPLYIEEVIELTSELRTTAEWEDVRKLVLAAGFNPTIVLLASFMEGEDGEEWGVIVTNEKRVFGWFRHDVYNPNSDVSWKELTDDPELTFEYPQILAAFSLLPINAT